MNKAETTQKIKLIVDSRDFDTAIYLAFHGGLSAEELAMIVLNSGRVWDAHYYFSTFIGHMFTHSLVFYSIRIEIYLEAPPFLGFEGINSTRMYLHGFEISLEEEIYYVLYQKKFNHKRIQELVNKFQRIIQQKYTEIESQLP